MGMGSRVRSLHHLNYLSILVSFFLVCCFCVCVCGCFFHLLAFDFFQHYTAYISVLEGTTWMANISASFQ